MFNKLILYQYINKITKNDIYNYGLSEGIDLSNSEIDIIYDYIKNKYKDIINKPDMILMDVKSKLSEKAYIKLLELYDKYKDMLYFF